MGQNAVYIAIDDNSLETLWQLDDRSFRDRFLEIEEDDEFERLDIAKIWDALHCTLTGISASDPIDGNKLSEAIVGVHPKEYDDEDYTVYVSVIDNAEIRPILDALEEFDAGKLNDSINLVNWRRQKIYPQGIWDDPLDDLVAEMDHALRSMREFFREALTTDKHILASFL